MGRESEANILPTAQKKDFQGTVRLTVKEVNSLPIDTYTTSIRSDDRRDRDQSTLHYYDLLRQGAFCFSDKSPTIVKTDRGYIATDWHMVLEAFRLAEDNEGDFEPDQWQEILDTEIALTFVEGSFNDAIKMSCKANLNTRPLSPSDRAVAYMSYLEALQEESSASALKEQKFSANQLSKALYQKRDEIAPRILQAFFAKAQDVRDEPPKDATRFIESGERVFIWKESLDERPFKIGVVQTSVEDEFYEVKDVFSSQTIVAPRLNLFPLDLKVRNREKPKVEIESDRGTQVPEDPKTPQWRNDVELEDDLREDREDRGGSPTNNNWEEKQESSGDFVGDTDVANDLSNAIEEAQKALKEEREKREALEREKDELAIAYNELQKRTSQLQEVARQKEELQQHYQDLEENYGRLHDRWEKEVQNVREENNKLKRENQELRKRLEMPFLNVDNAEVTPEQAESALEDLGFATNRS